MPAPLSSVQSMAAHASFPQENLLIGDSRIPTRQEPQLKNIFSLQTVYNPRLLSLKF